MATVFDTLFAQSAFQGLLAQFGESITYYPAGGGSRSITAIVDREPPAIMDAAGNAVVPQFIVRVYNSASTGVSSQEINTGGDHVEFVKRIGEVLPARMSICQIISHSAGVMRFSVV